MASEQHRKQKRCACGRGTCFTDGRPGSHRDDKGNFICAFCVFDTVMADARAKVSANLERRAD